MLQGALAVETEDARKGDDAVASSAFEATDKASKRP